jgi:hypothetical protein
MFPAPRRGELSPEPAIPWQLEQLPAYSWAPSWTLGEDGSVVGRTIPD